MSRAEPVDVLAAMDRAARRAADERDQHDANNAKEFADGWEAMRSDLRAARAAIAELIEHNTVMRAALSACPCFCQDEDDDGDAATCDRCAALARVGSAGGAL